MSTHPWDLLLLLRSLLISCHRISEGFFPKTYVSVVREFHSSNCQDRNPEELVQQKCCVPVSFWYPNSWWQDSIKCLIFNNIRSVGPDDTVKDLYAKECYGNSVTGPLINCKGLSGSRGGFRKEDMWPEYLNKRPGWGQVLFLGLRRSCWGHGLVTFPGPSWWPLGTRGTPTHWWHCSLVLHCESTLLICTY